MSDESQLISIFLKIYFASPFYHTSWTSFWKSYYQKFPGEKSTLENFIATESKLLSEELNTLGPNNPLSKKFVVSLPLRLSKTILSWPTTPEMLRDLMTD